MTDKRHVHAAAFWHLEDITARIIAESGIPSDRFHFGKIILQSLKDDPDMVAQIDGATGQSETNGSVLKRSIQCAISFRKLGLKLGDVIILMAPNHLDLVVPIYAALFEGIIVAPTDAKLGIAELRYKFMNDVPKMVFCQSEKVPDVKLALDKAYINAKVISFDDSDNADSFAKLMNLESEMEKGENYRPVEIDPAECIGILIPTSGTTGLPKSAATTHKNLAVTAVNPWCRTTEIPYIKRPLVVSPLQWVTAMMNYLQGPIMKFTRIQSSLPSTQQHIYDIINTYKLDFMVINPNMMTTLLNPRDRDNCDFTCFKSLIIGGSAVYGDLLSVLKNISPETEAVTGYGISEISGMGFQHGYSSPLASCGKPLYSIQNRLVDVETGAEINEPNKNGELWFKGPAIFKCYYNNPEVTKEAFTEDGWFKSGDLFYRDKSWNFYFVERLKFLLKYRNHQISPVELESVIIQHPGVLYVAVTGLPDLECGDLPVACVVRTPGHHVTAQEIKDLVKENLTDTKQLRGGVVFFDQLPMTASNKVQRNKIKEMVLQMKRE